MLKRKFTKVLSVFLCTCMMVSVIPSASATDSSSSPESENPVGNVINDVSVSGTNSFGEMLSEAYYDDYSQEEINGYDVYSVDFVDNVATVEFDTLQSATLVVGLYNEDEQSRMITSESVQVSKGETSTEITFDSEKMPEYFIIKAYLVDSKTFRPLNKEYTSPKYTKDMQDLKKLSTTNFSEERVLNLDDDTEKDDDTVNNFAVYDSEVKVIPETEETNVLESADDTNGTYVFENIDDSISSLQVGNIFSYAYGDDGLIIAKVSGITIDGTKATITSTDVEMKDVFDYVKIYAVSDASQATIGSEELPEGVVYNGLINNVSKTTSKGVVASGASSNSVSSSDSVEIALPTAGFSFGINDFEINNNEHLKFNGNVTLGLEPKIEFNLTPENQYFQVEVDYALGVNASVSAEGGLETPTNPTNSGETATTASSPTNSTESTTAPATSTNVVASSSASPMSMIASGSTSSVSTVEARGNLLPRIIDFFSVTFTPVAGVTISITPGLAFSASAELSFTAQMTGTVGLCISNNGVDNRCTVPKVNTELKIEGSVFVGVVLRPEVSALAGLANVELDGTAGVELNASTDFYSFDLLGEEDCIHECDNCISGELLGKISLGYSANIMNLDCLTVSGDLLSFEFEIGNFYWSITHMEAGFGECPYKKYRITANVVDSADNPIESARVNVVDNEGEVVKIGTAEDYGMITDKEGKVSFYLKSGEYDFTASDDAGKYSEVSEKVTVEDEAKSVYIELVTETGPVQLSFGRAHSACLTGNGYLYMWGNNSVGHLGIGETVKYKDTPIKTMSGVRNVSLGINHSACVTENDELYTWGHNEYYQLGDGTTNNSNIPVQIMKDVSVSTVTLGHTQGSAITKSKELYVWGYNNGGQLGNGTTIHQSTPECIEKLSGVKMVSMSNNHGAAITEDKALYMWGNNSYGKLGIPVDKKVTQYSSPRYIMSGVEYVDLGYDHSACITENGELYMWGKNSFGQLGIGTAGINNYIDSPTLIMEGVKFKDVSLGASHSGAITKDGRLYMWGDNTWGQLGNGTNEDSLIPIEIEMPGKVKVKELELGENYTGVITEDGKIYTWGYNNSNGQLGLGKEKRGNQNTPQEVTLPAETNDVVASSSKKSTVIASGAGAKSSNSFENLQPNEIYNFYAMKSRNVAKPLSSENLLYITQGVSDENGVLNIECTMTEDYENAVCFVVPMKQIDLSNATVTMDNLVYNGKEQFIHPTVTLDGVILTEGKDYELCNYYYAQNVGEYKVTIRGIGSYNGAIEFTYYVNSKLGDVNFDGKVSIIDAVLVLKCILNPAILSDEAQIVADMNQDGEISIIDAIMIQRALLYS